MRFLCEDCGKVHNSINEAKACEDAHKVERQQAEKKAIEKKAKNEEIVELKNQLDKKIEDYQTMFNEIPEVKIVYSNLTPLASCENNKSFSELLNFFSLL